MTRKPESVLPGPPDPWTSSSMPAFRGKPPYVMSEMIAAEPAHAERLLHRLANDEAFAGACDTIRAAADARLPIHVTGCGTSEHAGMAISLLLDEGLGSAPGRETRVVTALDAGRRPLGEGVLVAVSHEGGTRATTEAISAARGAGATTVLITVGAGSPGAEAAEHVIQTGEQDQSWCHTIGYLSPIIVGVALGAALRGQKPDAAAVRSLLSVAEDARPAADVAAALHGLDRLLVVGSGVDYVTARELALKIAEGAHLPTLAFELETLLHGHLAAADRWTGLVLVDTDEGTDRTFATERADRVLAAAKALRITTAAIVSESRDGQIDVADTPAGRAVLPHTGRVPGAAGRLMSSAIVLQLLAERLARARGLNPDTIGREDAGQAAAHSG